MDKGAARFEAEGPRLTKSEAQVQPAWLNRSFELCPQLGGCRPFPRSESSIKGIRILVAEQVPHLCDIDIRPVEILARQFLARLQKQLTKSRTVVVDPPLQGAIA